MANSRMLTVLGMIIVGSCTFQLAKPTHGQPESPVGLCGGIGQLPEEDESRRGFPAVTVAWEKPALVPTWLTDAQQQIEAIERNRRKLKVDVHADADGIALDALIRQWGKQAGIAVWINAAELDLLGVDPDTLVTLHATARLAELLDLVLEPLELTYRVREVGLEITSRDGADANPTVRFFDMALVIATSEHARPLVYAIEESIDPHSWVRTGGTSNIQVVGSMLVVSAPDSTHRKIEVFFAQLARHSGRHFKPSPVTHTRQAPAKQTGNGIAKKTESQTE